MRAIQTLVCATACGSVVPGVLASLPATGAVSEASAVPLSDAEAEWLTCMREEEKLIRDVYLNMGAVSGFAVFSRIAASEQRHMDALKRMVDRYGLSDPVRHVVGEFAASGPQARYDDLVAEGSYSYLDGLYVGATMEEIDLIDLRDAMQTTVHGDLLSAYGYLLEGTRRHLRVLVRAMANEGLDYRPQFIGEELWREVTATGTQLQA